jgi:hypothetical protein
LGTVVLSVSGGDQWEIKRAENQHPCGFAGGFDFRHLLKKIKGGKKSAREVGRGVRGPRPWKFQTAPRLVASTPRLKNGFSNLTA